VEAERIIDEFVRSMPTCWTSEQKLIALLRFLEEIERDSWRVIQLTNAIWIAQLVAIANSPRGAIPVYRSSSRLVLRITRQLAGLISPSAGRAPPVEMFLPIPKFEMGSCARSDLPADSAYSIQAERLHLFTHAHALKLSTPQNAKNRRYRLKP